ncbi:MAG: hypothetical protein ACI9JU_002052, partial [Pseudohongiellaceae bacterium]
PAPTYEPGSAAISLEKKWHGLPTRWKALSMITSSLAKKPPLEATALQGAAAAATK